MDIFTIYCYTFPNGKRYIGQTKNSIERRYNNGYGYKGQAVGDAIEKYGWDNVEKEIIDIAYSQEDADQFEIKYIKKFNTLISNSKGYNVSEGGSGGGNGYNTWSEEKKAEHKEKQRNSQLGEKCHFYGKNHSDKTRKLMSEKAKANNPFKGKCHSEETKAKWDRKEGNNPKARKIIIIDKEKDTKEIKDTLKEASEYMGMSYSTIRTYLSKGKNSYKNFLFFYKEDK